MASYDLSTTSLYRYRYLIGYALIGFLLTSLLLFAGFFLPGGLSTDEMNAVVVSNGLSVTDVSSFAVIDMPYHALQSVILHLFGITVLTIKLPSLLLGLASAIGIILLLRRWFRPSIAVLGSLIAVTNSHFLFIAQSGTADIMLIFWPVMLLLLGTQVTRVQKWRFVWKVLFSITAALSLYTPLSAYVLLAVILAVVLHPHLRNIIRKLSNVRMAVVSLLFLLLSAPLVYLLGQNPDLLRQLLGIPSVWPIDIPQNVRAIIEQYFLFWQPNTNGTISPVFGLGSVILMLFGAYRIFRTRETTRSYLIIIWFLCLVPVTLLELRHTSVTFVPSVLLLTAGLQTLIGYWYSLFPRNPYARIAGLIPIVILVSASIILGITRYAYGYHYSPSVVPLFSKDLALLPKDISQLRASDGEEAFWKVVAAHRAGLSIVNIPTDEFYAITKAAHTGAPEGYVLYRIVTSPLSNDADRFYIYQNTRN